MPYKNKEDLYKSQQKIRDRNHNNLWEYLSDKCCTDCNLKDPRVLEFDHLPQYEKKFEIAKAISGSTRSWVLILSEINKCEIVCSNCHKIRTMERGNFKRYKSFIK
jgi:hypothetical protein